MMFKDRHIGIFTLSFELLDRHPEVCMLIFRDVLPVKAEHDFTTRSIRYCGISRIHFEEVPPHQIIPEYIFTFSTMEDGSTIMCECEKTPGVTGVFG